MRQQQQGGGMSWVVGHRTGQGQANGLTCSSNQRNQGTLTTRQPRISRQRHLATERPSGTCGSEREKCQPPSTSTARRLDAVHAVQGGVQASQSQSEINKCQRTYSTVSAAKVI